LPDGINIVPLLEGGIVCASGNHYVPVTTSLRYVVPQTSPLQRPRRQGVEGQPQDQVEGEGYAEGEAEINAGTASG